MRRAWAGDARTLLLKGALADEGALESLLERPATAPVVVAAVFNEVDDALSSKRSGVLPMWQLGNLGKVARAHTIAVRNGWTSPRPQALSRPGAHR